MSLEKRHVNGYVILNEINRGTMGVIYRAERDGKIYALKMPQSNNLEASVFFRKEAMAIARLNHPNLIRIYDAGEFEGVPYIVMELLEGKSLERLLKSGPLPHDLSLKFAMSIASALAEIHKFGMVHRDIKSANMLVTDAGDIKLLDFGLAGDMSEIKDEDQLVVVGTILYASPEQCKVLRRPVDKRSDLYSFGITLYECITGEVPFKGEDIAELMKMHAAIPAPSVREKRKDASFVLSAIVAKLLEKDPDDRYQSSEGLIFDLQQISKLEATYKQNGKVNLGARDRLFVSSADLPLAGRKTELETLKKYWTEAAGGAGRAVIIEGESGSGKSRLTQELVAGALSRDCLVLHGKCQQLSAGVPLAPIRDAIDSFLNKISFQPEYNQIWFTRIKAAARGAIHSLNMLSPGFKDIIGDSGPNNSFDPASDKQRFLGDICEFISNIAQLMDGIVFLIDDIQWMDRSSQDFLTKLSDMAGSRKIFILLTSRNDVSSVQTLSKFKDEAAESLSPSIKLGPLTPLDVNDIIAGQLGGGKLVDGASVRIGEAANGNPFVITEYIRAMLNSGHLLFANGNWSIDQSAIASMRLSNNVIDLILNRISSINSKTKNVLAFASVFGNEFDIPTLINASGSSEEEVVASIQEASRNNLIGLVGGDTYRFSHDKFREALLSTLSPERLRDLNDALGLYLDQLEAKEKPWFEIARFYTNGHVEKHPESTYRSNFEAGRLALRNYSFQQAFDLFKLALQFAQKFNADHDTLKTFARWLAVASSESGNEKEAHEAIEIAKQYSKTTEDISDLNNIKMRAYFNYGRVNHAWLAFKEIAENFGQPYPRYELWKWLMIGWLAPLMIGRLVSGFLFGRIGRTHRRRKQVVFLAEIYLYAATISPYRARRSDGLLTMLQALQLAHSLGRCPEFAMALCNPALTLSAYRMKNLCLFLLEWAREMTDLGTDRATATYIDHVQSRVLYNSGDHQSALELHGKIGPDVIKFLGPHEISHWVNLPQVVGVVSARNREALEFVQTYVPLIENFNQFFLSHAYLGLAMHLKAVGRVQEGVEWQGRAARIIEANGKDLMDLLVHYNELEFDVDLEEGQVDINTDLTIDFFRGLRTMSPTAKIQFAIICYIRLLQLEKSQGEEQKRRARTNLKIALRHLFQIAYVPSDRCHLYIAKAGLARHERKFSKALRYVETGYDLGKQAASPRALFYAARERARIYRDMGDELRKETESSFAHAYALNQGWDMRAAAIEREFGLVGSSARGQTSDSAAAGKSLHGHTLHGQNQTVVQGRTVVRTSSDAQTIVAGRRVVAKKQSITKEERSMAALMQVSAASTGSLDPQEQTRAVLDVLIKLFGAERAFLFLSDAAPDEPDVIYNEKSA